MNMILCRRDLEKWIYLVGCAYSGGRGITIIYSPPKPKNKWSMLRPMLFLFNLAR